MNVLKNITINSTAFEAMRKVFGCEKHASQQEGNEIPENGNDEGLNDSGNNHTADQSPSSTINSNETSGNSNENQTTPITKSSSIEWKDAKNERNDLIDNGNAEASKDSGNNSSIDQNDSSPTLSNVITQNSNEDEPKTITSRSHTVINLGHSDNPLFRLNGHKNKMASNNCDEDLRRNPKADAMNDNNSIETITLQS